MGTGSFHKVFAIFMIDVVVVVVVEFHHFIITLWKPANNLFSYHFRYKLREESLIHNVIHFLFIFSRFRLRKLQQGSIFPLPYILHGIPHNYMISMIKKINFLFRIAGTNFNNRDDNMT